MTLAPLPRTRRERIASALGVAALHAGLGYLLVVGFGVELPRRPDTSLALFDVPVRPPPPQVEPLPRPTAHAVPEGRAAPPALRAAPKPVVAPPPTVPLPPSPVAAAPVAARGSDASAGAAPTIGPGIGAGGSGDGPGRGGRGEGAGGPALARRASRVSGELRNSDYPRAAVRARAQGDVIATLLIDRDGLVAACRVVRSSGSADLDATTCRLVRERFRYRPALDAQGRPVPDEVGWRQSWWLHR